MKPHKVEGKLASFTMIVFNYIVHYIHLDKEKEKIGGKIPSGHATDRTCRIQSIFPVCPLQSVISDLFIFLIKVHHYPVHVSVLKGILAF